LRYEISPSYLNTEPPSFAAPYRNQKQARLLLPRLETGELADDHAVNRRERQAVRVLRRDSGESDGGSFVVALEDLLDG
jgi:hypothetical protein